MPELYENLIFLLIYNHFVYSVCFLDTFFVVIFIKNMNFRMLCVRVVERVANRTLRTACLKPIHGGYSGK